MAGTDLRLRWFARIFLIVSAGLFVAGQEFWGGITVLSSVLLLIIGRAVQVSHDDPENQRD